MQTIQSIPLSNNAVKVLKERYLQRNSRGAVMETPAELFERVARSVAQAELVWGTPDVAEKWANVFYALMSSLLFLPNSPTLMNAGTRLSQLSACFVLPVDDSLEGIFTTLKQAALIQQSGGGTGFNFSHLRPKNDPITLTGGTASGPISFMKIFNAATEYVKYGGKRRGANMGILNIDHPDIEEFTHVKNEEGVLNNFNISVGISDAFMQAVECNEKWDLVHPGSRRTIKTVKAASLWNSIIENAWTSGDPGLVFLDTINQKNPLPALGKIECTNPCGEVPLLPYESCNLGSINLAGFADQHGAINWKGLESAIHTAIRFLDDVIEINNYLFPEIKTMVQNNRKVGLGVMGWADLLIRMQFSYDSDAAIQLAHKVMLFFQEKSFEASTLLAAERGNFPNWNRSIFHPHQPMRNATRLSIAPTGTISIIAGTSSSIEPLFAIAYERKNVLDGATLPEVHELFLEYIREYDLYTPQLIEEVKEKGHLQDMLSLPTEVKDLFKTAAEISPDCHLKHQKAFQQYVDNAVSKTINLPESATVGDIDQIYKKAWKQGLKGITIYRNKSRSRQVLEKGIAGKTEACKVCPV